MKMFWRIGTRKGLEPLSLVRQNGEYGKNWKRIGRFLNSGTSLVSNSIDGDFHGNLRDDSKRNARNGQFLGSGTSLFSYGLYNMDKNAVNSSLLLDASGRRQYHATTRNDNIALYALSVSMVAIGVKIGANALINREDARNAAEAAKEEEKETDKGSIPNSEKSDPNTQKVSWVAEFLSKVLGKTFYAGGFEDTMTRREAALILGIRESAPKKKVREAHRRLSILNHPDTGGSTYVSSKVNEAKELLLGRR